MEPGVVGLGGERPALDFDVGAVLVGERALVHRAVVPLPPGPALLARKFPVVGGLDDAAVGSGVVGPEEIRHRAVGEDRSGFRVVRQAGEVHAVVLRPAVIGRAEVVGGQGHRVDEPGAGPLREGGVVPEVVGMRERRRVEEANGLVQAGDARTEREAHLPAGAEGLLHLADDQGGGTVRVLDPGHIHRRVTADGVSLRAAVPLDAAGDPGAPERDEAGADDPVVVEHLLVPALVEHPLDAPADLRQAGDLQVFVLQEEGAPDPRTALRTQVVLHGVGIDDRAVGLPELRIRVVGEEVVGGERQFPFPDPHRLRRRLRGGRRGEGRRDEGGHRVGGEGKAKRGRRHSEGFPAREEGREPRRQPGSPDRACGLGSGGGYIRWRRDPGGSGGARSGPDRVPVSRAGRKASARRSASDGRPPAHGNSGFRWPPRRRRPLPPPGRPGRRGA